MSADNWARCPRCVQDARAEFDELVETLDREYGQMPRAEWEELQAAVNVGFDPLKIPATVREDWEVGLDGNEPEDAVIIVSYKARCEKCGAHAETDTRLTLTR